MRYKVIAVLALFACLICCFACGEEARASFFPTPYQKAQSITYVRDDRTHLCFVYNIVQDDHGLNWPVFTQVTCSPEVENLIKK